MAVLRRGRRRGATSPSRFFSRWPRNDPGWYLSNWPRDPALLVSGPSPRRSYWEDASMTPSQACVSLVQQFEGCEKRRSDGGFDAYPDPGTGGDPWTIGWGSTGGDIKRGIVWTQQQCDDRLARDLGTFSAG